MLQYSGGRWRDLALWPRRYNPLAKRGGRYRNCCSDGAAGRFNTDGTESFLIVLGVSLIFTGLTLLLPRKDAASAVPMAIARYMPLIAAPLGFLAGLVGIGGGIFLAPLLHVVRWNSARAIAATASLFILVNSIFGLVGQLLKRGPDMFGAALSGGLPLLLAVVIGGQIGSLLAIKFLPQNLIRWLTAALTIWVGARLLL